MRPSPMTAPLWCLFAIAAALPASEGSTVARIRVQPDQAPDCSSLKSIVESVTRGCATNDAKAIAIYNFMQLSHYHRQYPSEPGGIPALKEITNYGWSLCGGLHCVQSALWREAGWGWRFVGWSNPGHTTVEAEYDGSWHYLDVFLKFYAWMPDGKGGRTIAGQGDIANDPGGLLTGAFTLDKGRAAVYANGNQFVMAGDRANWRAPDFLTCGDGVDGIASGVKSRNNAGSPDSWNGINHADGAYVTDVDLEPGHALTCTWDAIPDAWYWEGSKTAPAHTCGGHKDTRNDPGYGLILEPYINAKAARGYGNGMVTFAPDFSSQAMLKGFVSAENVVYADKGLAPADQAKPAVLVFRLASPYDLITAGGAVSGAAKVEVSVDGGKAWTAVDAKDFGPAVKGKLAALVRLTFSERLTAMRFEGIVQNNPGSLPYLSPGRNVVAVSVGDAAQLGDSTLVVTYAYRLGSRSKSFEQLCEQGKEIAKQHNAAWSDTVVYARRSFTAKDLPGTFAIDCPTPQGQHPVYPRMLFMRREVLAPGAAPLPLPDGAVEARPAVANELQTLPNPFLVGSETAPVIKPRATKTIELPLAFMQFCDVKGAVGDAGTLRWPKNPQEADKVPASVMLITGDLAGLPAKDIAAARLCVPVLRGHGSAAGQLGVVFLKSAPVKGAPVDFAGLPDAQGSGLVPKQPAGTAEYVPARIVPIDITREIRAIAAKEASFNGLAVRMVPNRAVDEGYTVRCDLASSEKVILQVDVYADAP